MTTFADLSPEARAYCSTAVIECSRIAAEREREACARTVETMKRHPLADWGDGSCREEIAAAIRARSA